MFKKRNVLLMLTLILVFANSAMTFASGTGADYNNFRFWDKWHMSPEDYMLYEPSEENLLPLSQVLDDIDSNTNFAKMEPTEKLAFLLKYWRFYDALKGKIKEFAEEYNYTEEGEEAFVNWIQSLDKQPYTFISEFITHSENYSSIREDLNNIISNNTKFYAVPPANPYTFRPFDIYNDPIITPVPEITHEEPLPPEEPEPTDPEPTDPEPADPEIGDIPTTSNNELSGSLSEGFTGILSSVGGFVINILPIGLAIMGILIALGIAIKFFRNLSQ